MRSSLAHTGASGRLSTSSSALPMSRLASSAHTSSGWSVISSGPRAAHLALSGSGAPGQQDIDAVFGAAAPVVAATLPKGLSPQTADLVQSALREAGELSAAECADAVGISRVSARRYLEHFVARGSAAVRLQYGGGGRPERRYRST